MRSFVARGERNPVWAAHGTNQFLLKKAEAITPDGKVPSILLQEGQSCDAVDVLGGRSVSRGCAQEALPDEKRHHADGNAIAACQLDWAASRQEVGVNACKIDILTCAGEAEKFEEGSNALLFFEKQEGVRAAHESSDLAYDAAKAVNPANKSIGGLLLKNGWGKLTRLKNKHENNRKADQWDEYSRCGRFW